METVWWDSDIAGQEMVSQKVLVGDNCCKDLLSVGTGPAYIHTWMCGRLRGQSLQAAPKLSVDSSHAPRKNILTHPPLESTDQNILPVIIELSSVSNLQTLIVGPIAIGSLVQQSVASAAS